MSRATVSKSSTGRPVHSFKFVSQVFLWILDIDHPKPPFLLSSFWIFSLVFIFFLSRRISSLPQNIMYGDERCPLDCAVDLPFGLGLHRKTIIRRQCREVWHEPHNTIRMPYGVNTSCVSLHLAKSRALTSLCSQAATRECADRNPHLQVGAFLCFRDCRRRSEVL